MYTSAAVRSLVETWAAENNVGRVRSFHASLVGMVLPDDSIEVRLQHTGMISGRKIIKIEASNKETEDKVLLAEAEVEQPVSAYVFTGQGSQEQGMGMELYASSAVAKEVWDRADRHFMEQYGKRLNSANIVIYANRILQALRSRILSATTRKSSPYISVDLGARQFVPIIWP